MMITKLPHPILASDVCNGQVLYLPGYEGPAELTTLPTWLVSITSGPYNRTIFSRACESLRNMTRDQLLGWTFCFTQEHANAEYVRRMLLKLVVDKAESLSRSLPPYDPIFGNHQTLVQVGQAQAAATILLGDDAVSNIRSVVQALKF